MAEVSLCPATSLGPQLQQPEPYWAQVPPVWSSEALCSVMGVKAWVVGALSQTQQPCVGEDKARLWMPWPSSMAARCRQHSAAPMVGSMGLDYPKGRWG